MKTKYFCILFPILLSGCASLAQTHSTSPQRTIAESTSNLLDGIELRKNSDIDQRLKAVKDDSLEEAARAIAEVDEWLYVAEDEEPARKRIETEIEKLRAGIETEVTRLSKDAIDAPDGKTSTEKMSKINSLLSLYPAPKTDEKRAKLEQITSSILNTSRRVEDIRRLRYNEWAISYIKSSLEFYRGGTKLFPLNKRTDKEALVNACVNWMSTIDPAFLEPAVMDLHNYVYGLTRDAVGDDEYRIKLAKGFANPNTKRKTPSDF